MINFDKTRKNDIEDKKGSNRINYTNPALVNFCLNFIIISSD
jgi:hypothetical protein